MFRDQKAHTISGKRADFQGQSTTLTTARQKKSPSNQIQRHFRSSSALVYWSRYFDKKKILD